MILGLPTSASRFDVRSIVGARPGALAAPLIEEHLFFGHPRLTWTPTAGEMLISAGVLSLEISDELTAYTSDWFPGLGEIDVDSFDFVRATWHPFNPVNVLAGITSKFYVDGALVASSWVANGDGTITVTAAFPFELGHVYTIKAEISTADSVVNSRQWLFTARKAVEDYSALIDYAIGRSEPFAGLVDYTATTGRVYQDGLVDFLALISGLATSSPGLVDFTATQGVSFADFTPGLVELIVSKEYLEPALQLSALIGYLMHGDLLLATDVRADVVEQSQTIAIGIQSDKIEGSTPLSIEIGHLFERDWLLSAVIGKLHESDYQLSADAEGALVWLLALLTLYNEETARAVEGGE